MRQHTIKRRTTLQTMAGALAALCISGAFAQSVQAAEPGMIYLTRHGEKASGADKDPPLTAQGQSRARQLAAILRSSGIKSVYSTATNRTRQTAQPLATMLGLEVQIYDAAQPAKLVEKVRSLATPTLIVGHSNTVPDLVKLLGGKPGPDIDDMEFDRLYQVIVAPDGTVTTVLLHSVAQ